MSIDQHITQLEALAGADNAIKQLQEQVEHERSDIEGVRVELAELERRLQTDQESISEMEKTRGELVQEIRTISTQIDRSRERLGRARNEREVNAAERELDELRKLQRDRDDEVKKLVALCEGARTSVVEGEQRKQELDARLQGTLEGKTASIAGFEEQLAALVSEREKVAEQLPSRVYRRYQSMHERGKVPIAKTHDGTCLGCYVQLPPMMFHNMLSRLQFEECPNCHRIIYYQPAAPEGDAPAGDDAATADQSSGDAPS